IQQDPEVIKIYLGEE
ncbi:MAG: hypothetical protein KKA76_11960, partial [Proteobacteria bacterium]|nr:hypothetical protein [Pseudomonadota bacterium]